MVCRAKTSGIAQERIGLAPPMGRTPEYERRIQMLAHQKSRGRREGLMRRPLVSVENVSRFVRQIGARIATDPNLLSMLPYPVSVRRKPRDPEKMPCGWGPETFDQIESIEINEAR